MSRRWLPAAVAGVVMLFVLGLLFVLASGFGHTPGSVQAQDVLVGKRAPNFTLRSVSGGELSLHQFAGHPVVLNFWASWCGPCKQEHPYLLSAYRRFASRGVRFLGVSFRDQPSAARSFVRKYGGSWPDASDEDGEVAVQYGVTGPPETFVIDARGIIRYHAAGVVFPGTRYAPSILDRQIEKVMRSA